MLSRKSLVVMVMLCVSGVSWATFIDASQISVTTCGGELTGSSMSLNLLNGSGLQPDMTLNKDATDNQNWLCNIGKGRWINGVPTNGKNYSPSGIQGDGWIQFEFNSAQTISNMWVWNYNNPNYLGRGYHYVAVDYSTDGTTWTRLGGSGTYTTFAQAAGTDGYICNNVIDLGSISIKKICLTVKFAGGNYGDPSWAGLSEVRFEQVPEPTTMMLLGLGALGFIRRKRS